MSRGAFRRQDLELVAQQSDKTIGLREFGVRDRRCN